MHRKWNTIEKQYESVRGSFSTEQFGVFLNMHSGEINENYLVAFHEDYHYWQSIFTPYGHLKWGVNRTASTNIIEAWLSATANSADARIVPAADILPTDDKDAVLGVSKIFTQYMSRRFFDLTTFNDPSIKKYMPPKVTQIVPVIEINGQPYEFNGIDILEGFAKYQEALFAFIAEGKSFSETINHEKLSPRYYIALEYFIEHIGEQRIIEFPLACELALCVDDYCKIGEPGWQEFHPAWRFIKIVDVLSKYDKSHWLSDSSIRERYQPYASDILIACGYKDFPDFWDSGTIYAKKENLDISRDMLRAIEFKQRYPWILAYPFTVPEVFHEMTEFRPYYYITTDSSGFIVKSEDHGNEIILENQYQALANQICGIMSDRCQDRGKIQCGYSYYGIKRCPYNLMGTCDGHLDRDSSLPEIEMDIDGNIVDGCAFDVFLSLMGVRVKDLLISDICKKIDPTLLKKMMKKHFG